MANSQEQESPYRTEHEEPLSKVERGWKGIHLVQDQGTWVPPKVVPWIISCRQHFKAQEDDIILVSAPKSGTTWLKAIIFALVNRTSYDLHNHPLLTTNPHDLVPFLVTDVHASNQIPDLTSLPSPRLFSSHFSYELLPPSIIESNCRLVFLCRNPKDTFVSMWHFFNKMVPENEAPASMEEAFELFCGGISPHGPFWEHVLGYWKASLERPERVLFIKYEEMKEEPLFHIRRLAEFVGCPFSAEEDREGLVENILRLCSFENLKSLEVNMSGTTRIWIERKHFFRRGVVRDWKNHLKPEMIEKLDQLTQQKLEGSGLSFKD